MTKAEFTILRCSAFGVNAVESNPRHVFPRHTHEQYGIGVIQHGAQKSWSGCGLVEAGPGNAITVNPGEVHDGAPIGDAGRSWRMLYFDPPIVAAAMDDMTGGKRATMSSVIRSSMMRELPPAFSSCSRSPRTLAEWTRCGERNCFLPCCPTLWLTRIGSSSKYRSQEPSASPRA